ncbi:fungal transcriptional regulatory-like protein [Rhypophila decipiens]
MEPSDIKAEPSPPSPPSPSLGSGGQGSSQPTKKSSVRRRTKTGCLTCRKRRIKCDEGKPTCGNCIKSKRQCDGYNQRLTFKEPLGSFAHGPLSGHPTYHPQTQEALIAAQLSASQARTSSSQGQLPIIAPRPPPPDITGNVPLAFGTGYQDAPRSSISTTHSLSPGLYSPSCLHPTLLTPDSAIAPPIPQGVHQPLMFDELPPALPAHGPQGQLVLDHAPAIQGIHHPSVSPPAGQQLISPAQSAPLGEPLVSPEEGYWQSDDDASMAESEDEAAQERNLAHLEQNDLGIQVVQHLGAPPNTDGTSMRTFAGNINQNTIETYIPSSTSSPLNDPQTAAVFWHFVNVTGRIMSLYERNPVDPGPMFQGRPIPRARQNIWTYVFPITSFSHPALMQGMLALGSLQIAKRQGLPPTAAMKHYHLSLRRIAKNYQSHIKRTQPATLAATLLLGFYEVWNSDHEKWCKHMWGARAILREVPLQQMTRDIIALERKKRQQQLLNLGSDHQCDAFCQSIHEVPEHDPDWLDLSLISQISGKSATYSDAGYVVDGVQPSTRKYTERDIESYEQYRDLFWWFCKMDVYQSILGATPPFMEYDKWMQCAPRAQFGRIDAIHGTFDHLMLLLGRVVDFASRDMARKRKAKRAEAMQRGPGGAGQGPGFGPPATGVPPGMGPPPGMAPPGPGGPGQGQGQGLPPQMFPGMLPSSGRFDLPRGFSPPRDYSSPQSEATESEDDPEKQMAAAMREWDSIREAFELFRAHLGPDFQPMGSDIATPVMSPFGPALLYRTYSIAGIWLNYYMGLIVLYRARPFMPPIAMVAAGMSAPDTAQWANEIGRIAAGLHEDTSDVVDVSTLVAAVFIESCFCLFVAAIQYRDTAQRHWVIRRLYDIERLTGWQSARQIADGCESAWSKAAAMKRGPAYHRPTDLGPLFPQPVWAKPRRVDTRIRELQEASDGDPSAAATAKEGVGSWSSEENRLVLARSEQSHYALGLLSVEQDLDRLDLIGPDGKKERSL